ncbi:uncharacterized protein [Hetaerina americana]|uniref:uncharacterized protein n=1 Tax=Hetaerina americana TaxID=62018 RepID=UPI003A7F1C9A
MDVKEFGTRAHASLASERVNSWLHLAALAACFTGIFLMEEYSPDGRLLDTQMTVALCVSVWATLSMDSQFRTLLSTIGNRLRLTNESLWRLCLTSSGFRRTRLGALGERWAAVERTDLSSTRASLGCREYARSMCRLCHDLRRLSGDINDMYGGFVLLQTASNLVQLSAHIFFFLTVAGPEALTERRFWYEVMVVLVWSAPYVVALTLLLVASDGVIRELFTFSNHLANDKIRFTAKGFFPLDLSLMTSVTATVVSHVVVLIQFQRTT